MPSPRFVNGMDSRWLVSGPMRILELKDSGPGLRIYSKDCARPESTR